MADDVASLGLEVKSDSVPVATNRVAVFNQTVGQTADHMKGWTAAQKSTAENLVTMIGRTQLAGKELAQFNALRRAGTTEETRAGKVLAEVAGLQHDMARAHRTRKQAVDAELASMQQAVRLHTNQQASIRRTAEAIGFEMAQRGRSTREQAAHEALRRAGINSSAAEAAALMNLARSNHDNEQAMLRRNRVIESTTGLLLRQAAAMVALVAASYTLGNAISAISQTAGLGNLAERLKMSSDLIQVIRFQMQQAGGSFQEADQALDTFNRRVGEALLGQGYLLKFFKENGETVKKDVNENYLIAVRLLSQITDESKRAAVMQQLFSRNSREMIAVVGQGLSGISKTYQEMHKNNQILDQDTINTARRFDDMITTITDKMDKGFKKTIVDTADAVDKWGGRLVKWLNDIGIKAESAAKWLGTVALLSNPATIGVGLSALKGIAIGAPPAPGAPGTVPGGPPSVSTPRIDQGFAALLQAQMGRGTGAETKTPPLRENELDRAMKALRKQTEEVIAQADAYGKGAAAVGFLEARTKLLTAAQEAGLNTTGPLGDKIDALARKYAAAAEAAERAKIITDAFFERGLLGLTDTEAKIATTLRPLYGGDIERALKSAEAGLLRMNEQLKITRDLLTEAGTGLVRDFVQGLRNGENAWESFSKAATNALNRIADKLLEMAAQQLMQKAFGNALGMFGFGSPTPAPYGFAPAADANFLPSAKGNVFSSGHVIPFARGGIVNSPMIFPMAGGAGLMGEAGPEAVMPLRRGRDGRLGVASSGERGRSTQIVVNNYSSEEVKAESSFGPDGGEIVRIAVGAVRKEMSRGGFDKNMGRFGGRTQAIRR